MELFFRSTGEKGTGVDRNDVAVWNLVVKSAPVQNQGFQGDAILKVIRVHVDSGG